jgi:hypothetical protein
MPREEVPMALMRCEDAATRRRRVEMQGFTGLDDRTIRELDPWLRLSPALCMSWAAVGTALGSAPVVAALVPFAVAGAVGTRHPFDVIYERGFRPRLRTPSIPRYPAPRRFACAIASAWLAGTAAAFHWRAMTLGYALGASLVAAAAVPTFSGFCIPSWVYGLAGRRRGEPPAEAATTVERASVT